MPALIFWMLCKLTYYISLHLLLKVMNWVFPYLYYLLHWLIISQLLHPNIFQHMVASDHTENSYIIVQTWVSGVKWNFIVAMRYNGVAFIMNWLWDPFHKLLPRALGLAWQMKSGCEMVEMRTEEKQTEIMEPTVRWGAQEISSSLLLFFLYSSLLASLCTSTMLKTK